MERELLWELILLNKQWRDNGGYWLDKESAERQQDLSAIFLSRHRPPSQPQAAAVANHSPAPAPFEDYSQRSPEASSQESGVPSNSCGNGGAAGRSCSPDDRSVVRNLPQEEQDYERAQMLKDIESWLGTGETGELAVLRAFERLRELELGYCIPEGEVVSSLGWATYIPTLYALLSTVDYNDEEVTASPAGYGCSAAGSSAAAPMSGAAAVGRHLSASLAG